MDSRKDADEIEYSNIQCMYLLMPLILYEKSCICYQIMFSWMNNIMRFILNFCLCRGINTTKPIFASFSSIFTNAESRRVSPKEEDKLRPWSMPLIKEENLVF